MKTQIILQILLSSVLILTSVNSFGAHSDASEWTKVKSKAKTLTTSQKKARAKQAEAAKAAGITTATDKELDKLTAQLSRDITALEKNLCTLEIELTPTDRAKEILRIQELHRKISATDIIRDPKHAALREKLESDISQVAIWQKRVVDAELRGTVLTDKPLAAQVARTILAATAEAERRARNRAKQIRKAEAARQAHIAAAAADKK